MNILIVEDDRMLSDSLRLLLEKNDFHTECIHNGADGITYAMTGVYDLLILDVMMPEMNGYEVAKRIRSAHGTLPILMLTARSALEDEIEGLDSGADYYLTKPFDSRRLLACVHALLRRQGAHTDELILGDTALHLFNSTLSCGAQSVRLSAREFDVMRYLMASPNQILSKEQILCRVWGFNSNAVENHVEVYIGLLRKKLRYLHSGLRIETTRRMGYSIIAAPAADAGN